MATGTEDDVQTAAWQRIPAQLRSGCLYLDNGDETKYYFPGITKWSILFFHGIIVCDFFSEFYSYYSLFHGGREGGENCQKIREIYQL
jgi:hypothetical protein